MKYADQKIYIKSSNIQKIKSFTDINTNKINYFAKKYYRVYNSHKINETTDLLLIKIEAQYQKRYLDQAILENGMGRFRFSSTIIITQIALFYYSDGGIV